MAGPLGGISPQVPFATTFQPGQSASTPVRPDARQPKDNIVQARNAPASQSFRSETRDQNPLRSSRQVASNGGGNQQSAGNNRGSLLDVTV